MTNKRRTPNADFVFWSVLLLVWCVATYGMLIHRASQVTNQKREIAALKACIKNHTGYARNMILTQCTDDYYRMKGWR